MKGLLRNDIYTVSKCYRLFFVIMIVLMIGSVCASDDINIMAFYPCMLISTIPTSLVSFDERNKWNTYCGALPYSRRQYVASKYITGIIMGGIALIAELIACSVKMIVTGSFSAGTLAVTVSALLMCICAASAITLPFVFKFGAEKGRYIFIGFIAVLLAAAVIILDDVSFRFSDGFSAGYKIPALLCAAAVLLYAVSWIISAAIYERKDIA